MSGSKRISGMAFDITLFSTTIHVNKVTLTITDNSEVAKTRGIPDGYTDGDVSAEGDLELDTKNFTRFHDAAAAAGSYRGIEPEDILFYAKAGDEKIKVEAFGCKFLLDSLLDIDTAGSDKSVYKVKYKVTAPEFIKINGIPYLSADDVRDLIG
ncbi:phage protein [Escherichia coli]|uniref:phage protein n=1 Tax=Escherichia coli TaxID=562 RepID=UPI001FCE3DA1|nr:phage protein [Escherichia coli]